MYACKLNYYNLSYKEIDNEMTDAIEKGEIEKIIDILGGTSQEMYARSVGRIISGIDGAPNKIVWEGKEKEYLAPKGFIIRSYPFNSKNGKVLIYIVQKKLSYDKKGNINY